MLNINKYNYFLNKYIWIEILAVTVLINFVMKEKVNQNSIHDKVMKGIINVNTKICISFELIVSNKRKTNQ